MKINKVIILFLLMTITSIGYCQISFQDTIVKIEFKYLPWEYRAPRRLDPEMVRDYYGKNSVYSISDSNIIKEFEKSLIIFNMEPFIEMKFIDVRMVIDFYFNDESIKTFSLDYHGNIKYDDGYYYTNFCLLEIIKKYIPAAIIPK